MTSTSIGQLPSRPREPTAMVAFAFGARVVPCIARFATGWNVDGVLRPSPMMNAIKATAAAAAASPNHERRRSRPRRRDETGANASFGHGTAFIVVS